MEKITQQSKYEWIFYALSYLSVARIALEKLKNDGYTKKDFGERIIYDDRFVLVAVIWNIKHAIEVILKSLGIILDKKYLQIHDSKMLSVDLKRKLEPYKIYKPEKITELTTIVNKYYKLEFWNKKIIADKKVFDIQNDIFRYPDNCSSFYLDINILLSAKDLEINELFKDIELLRRLRAIIDVKIQIGL